MRRVVWALRVERPQGLTGQPLDVIRREVAEPSKGRGICAHPEIRVGSGDVRRNFPPTAGALAHVRYI